MAADLSGKSASSCLKGPRICVPPSVSLQALRGVCRDKCPRRHLGHVANASVVEIPAPAQAQAEPPASDFTWPANEITSTVTPHRDKRMAFEKELIRKKDYHLLHPRLNIPVYVMLPLDTIMLRGPENDQRTYIRREHALDEALDGLRALGVEGVMVDVWWGIVQHRGEFDYDFKAYGELFDKLKKKGLRVQAVMSFHAAGTNVGDICSIPLPKYVLEVGKQNPDIFYRDRKHQINEECLSLACDDEPLFTNNETPIMKYQQFMRAFVQEFEELIGEENLITEITVGMGPAGELRYPSYPEGLWSFPGIGEFQCYDKYMRKKLQDAAKAYAERKIKALGHDVSAAEAEALKEEIEKWGLDGPQHCGSYNSRPWEADCSFFHNEGGWKLEYGEFFLSWYSGELAGHMKRMLRVAKLVINDWMVGFEDEPEPRRIFKSLMQLWERPAGTVDAVSANPDEIDVPPEPDLRRVKKYKPLKNRGEHGELTTKVWENDEWKEGSQQKLRSCVLGVKLAGIHWYYKTDSHAAELTAGYYNAGRTSDGSLRNGYLPLLRILQAYKAHLSFTCVEMRDADHYARPDACCSPEALLKQVMATAAELDVPISGENALQRYDVYAFEQIAIHVPQAKRNPGGALELESRGKLNRLTFLRMNDVMLGNFDSFKILMERLNPLWKFE